MSTHEASAPSADSVFDDESEMEWIETDGESIADSGYEASGPPSIASSLFDYEYENGRRYHNYRAGKYVLPNDEVECDRLEMQHHIWRLVLRGEIIRAPIKNQPRRVVDLGTGTGIWACDAGDMWPDSKVLGLDLSPIQPGWVPPNVSFLIEDVEEKWTWGEPNSFDYIHIRNLAGAIADWPELFAQCYDYLAPGGWIEIQEHDILLLSDDDSLDKYPEQKAALETFYSSLFAASKILKRPFDVCDSLLPWLEGAKFIRAKQEIFKQPWGTWPAHPRFKEIGKWSLAVAETGADAYGLALLTRILGMESEQAQKVANAAKDAVFQRGVHLYTKNYVVYAQKPYN